MPDRGKDLLDFDRRHAAHVVQGQTAPQTVHSARRAFIESFTSET